jgi:nucleoside-diphosphate-sugar epimerase
MLVSAGRRALPEEALNIGSGSGITVRELAERIITLTQSRSALKLLPARSVEVTRFVADIRRAQAALDLTAPADPLYGLDRMLPRIERALESRARS